MLMCNDALSDDECGIANQLSGLLAGFAVKVGLWVVEQFSADVCGESAFLFLLLVKFWVFEFCNEPGSESFGLLCFEGR